MIMNKQKNSLCSRVGYKLVTVMVGVNDSEPMILRSVFVDIKVNKVIYV